MCNINGKCIGTKVDGKTAIMRLNTCNMCPFLTFDSHTKTAFCRNPKEDYLTKKVIAICYSYMYNDGYHFPLNDIHIPDWCQLNDLAADVIAYKKISYQEGGNVYTDTIQNFTEFHIYSDKNLKFNGCKLESKVLPNNQQKSLPQSTNNSSSVDRFSYNSTPYVKKDTCSLCGEYKEEVDRNNNLGMCNDCWDKISNKKDNDEIYFAYINNFRLKRKSSYSKSEFKKILDNIKLK